MQNDEAYALASIVASLVTGLHSAGFLDGGQFAQSIRNSKQHNEMGTVFCGKVADAIIGGIPEQDKKHELIKLEIIKGGIDNARD